MAPSMHLALITDELSDDPATAFELGRRWELSHFEIRSAYRWRLPAGPAFASERTVAAARASGAVITGISPGLFKSVTAADGSTRSVGASDVRSHLDELLPRSFELARRLGTNRVIVFALPRWAGQDAHGPVPAVVTDALAQAAARAARDGFLLMLENVPNSWADTIETTLAILQAVDSPALRLAWDPPNAVRLQPKRDVVGDGWAALAPYVANVHVKDVAYVDGRERYTLIGDGIVDWRRQLALLAAAGYAGPVTLETHLQYQDQPGGLVAATEQCLRRLRDLWP